MHKEAKSYFQLSEHLKAGKHGLSIDTDVALWIEYRKYNKRPDLMQVMDFVILIMNNTPSLMRSKRQ